MQDSHRLALDPSHPPGVDIPLELRHKQNSRRPSVGDTPGERHPKEESEPLQRHEAYCHRYQETAYYPFIIKDTTQEKPNGRDEQGKVGERRKVRFLTTSNPIIKHEECSCFLWNTIMCLNWWNWVRSSAGLEPLLLADKSQLLNFQKFCDSFIKPSQY